MILRVEIRERGATPRGFKKAHKAASAVAWVHGGRMWHQTYRKERFTIAHARKAGYALRKGEQSGLSDTEFWNSYTGQKLKKFHHKNPLQWSGEVKDKTQYADYTATGTMYREATSWTSIDSKGGGCKVAYRGANKLNYRRWPTSPHMADEFRKLLPAEVTAVARVYDTTYDQLINQDQTVTVSKVA
jgi:hypothetical protein